jgi:hypothetical protein
MSNRLALLVLAAALGIGAQATPSLAQQSARAAFEDLRNGGYVVVIRHGRTDESPANPRDETPTDLAQCAGQLMLNDTGKAQARAIGDAFKRAGIPVGKVLASGYCRAIEAGPTRRMRCSSKPSFPSQAHRCRRRGRPASS